MKRKNVQISLIALLTGVISFMSFEQIYAGKMIGIGAPSSDGKEVQVEDFDGDEIKDSEKHNLTRLRAEKLFAVLQTQDGKVEIKENDTKKWVVLDLENAQFTGTSAIILARAMAKIPSENIGNVQATIVTYSGDKADFENSGFSGRINTNGGFEVSGRGSSGLDLLNYWAAVDSGKFDGKPGMFLGHVTGIDKDAMAKLVTDVQGSKFKADLGRTKIFRDKFGKEKTSEILTAFAKYKDETPGYHEFSDGRELYNLSGNRRILLDRENQVIYCYNLQDFRAMMDSSTGHAVGAVIATGEGKFDTMTMKDLGFFLFRVKAGDATTVFMMSDDTEKREKFVDNFRDYNKLIYYGISFDNPEYFDAAAEEVKAIYEDKAVGSPPEVDFQKE